jgi:hypothetical protein
MAHPAPARFEEDMLVELTQTLESARECGYVGWSVFMHAENTVLQAWKSALAAPGQEKTALRRRFEAMEAIHASRPSLREFVNSEKIIEQLELLRVWNSKTDPSGFITRPPCWRELFSWRPLIAKSLNQVETFARETAVLLQTPEGYGQPDWDRHLSEDVHYDQASVQHWKDQGPSEAAEVTLWALARSATAIALFRAEKGRDPSSLAEVVPEYLPSIPCASPGNRPIEYREGFLQPTPPKDVSYEQWYLSPELTSRKRSR